MSLSQSLGIAVSGLTASAKGAENVAANLANLRTEGYGKRSLRLESVIGGGVAVAGIERHSNPVLLAERRLAQSATSGAETRSAFHAALQGWVGLPHEESSLSARLSRVEQALVTATEAPGNEVRLAEVLDALSSLTTGLKDASRQIQQARTQADQSISADVKLLNDTLAQVAHINRDIPRLTAMGKDVSTLIDQRQQLIDKIASIIPLREVGKDGGTVALYTMGGATLLDGLPAKFSYSPAGFISAQSGGLSGIALDGRALTTDDGGDLKGGRLIANFAIRDRLGPEAQARLDGFAADLINRLAQADTSLAPGQAGLLSDAGLTLQPGDELGISERITVNNAVDPRMGGDLWRIRTGIGATGPGHSGESSILSALSDGLSEATMAGYGGYSPVARSASGLAGELLSFVANNRLSNEADAAYAASRRTALEQFEAEEGVDSDHEVQMLMTIEKSYAANARVIQAVDEMLDSLLRI